jgi:hypothetical protein
MAVKKGKKSVHRQGGNADSLKILASTPAKLQRLVRGMSAVQLSRKPAKDAWSVGQIVAHLCDGEIVLAYRYRKILAEPGCKIQAYDQDKWAKNLRYGKADAGGRIRLFSTLRKSNVALLRSLSPTEWKRSGFHAERGKESISTIAALYAAHDLTHLSQISRRRKIR